LRRGAKEVIKRIRNVVLEAQFVNIEKPGALGVDCDRLNAHFHIAIPPERPPLTFARLKFFHIDSKRTDVPQTFRGPCFSVPVEYRPEMTPTQFPQRVHLLGRLIPTDEVFVFDRLHESIVAKMSRLSTASW
jgi:hypothetical protein